MPHLNVFTYARIDMWKNINRDIISQILEITKIYINIRMDKLWIIHTIEYYREMR